MNRALSHRLCAKRDRPAQPVSFIWRTCLLACPWPRRLPVAGLRISGSPHQYWHAQPMVSAVSQSAGDYVVVSCQTQSRNRSQYGTVADRRHAPVNGWPAPHKYLSAQSHSLGCSAWFAARPAYASQSHGWYQDELSAVLPSAVGRLLR